jgi:hypothetical protein
MGWSILKACSKRSWPCVRKPAVTLINEATELFRRIAPELVTVKLLEVEFAKQFNNAYRYIEFVGQSPIAAARGILRPVTPRHADDHKCTYYIEADADRICLGDAEFYGQRHAQYRRKH